MARSPRRAPGSDRSSGTRPPRSTARARPDARAPRPADSRCASVCASRFGDGASDVPSDCVSRIRHTRTSRPRGDNAPVDPLPPSAAGGGAGEAHKCHCPRQRRLDSALVPSFAAASSIVVSVCLLPIKASLATWRVADFAWSGCRELERRRQSEALGIAPSPLGPRAGRFRDAVTSPAPHFALLPLSRRDARGPSVRAGVPGRRRRNKAGRLSTRP